MYILCIIYRVSNDYCQIRCSNSSELFAGKNYWTPWTYAGKLTLVRVQKALLLDPLDIYRKKNIDMMSYMTGKSIRSFTTEVLLLGSEDLSATKRKEVQADV